MSIQTTPTHTTERESAPERRPDAGSGRPTILERVSPWANVVLAISAAFTLVFGFWNYSRTSEAELQLSALGTLQHYLDLAVQHPELATREAGRPVDAQYAWFAAYALSTAQTLKVLVGDQGDWRRGIDAIVRQHRAFLSSGIFVCDDFTPEFVAYVRTKVPEMKCAAAN